MDNTEDSRVIYTEGVLGHAVSHQNPTSDEVETSQSAPRFQYQGLNSEKDEIRLVRLLCPQPTGTSG
jgi:hypothetical protein